MIPAAYQQPAAIVLIAGGLLACFFGYRLFRVVLAVFGFIMGALAASSIVGVDDTSAMIVAGAVGGLAGAGLLYAAYFVGVALVGAGLGAGAAHALFSMTGMTPSYLIVVLLAIAGAAGAMYLQRYFIIVGTAFGGAWTLIVGALALAGDRAARTAAAAGDVWVVYPLDPAPGRRWVAAAWIVLSVIGAAVQFRMTGRGKGRVGKRRSRRAQS